MLVVFSFSFLRQVTRRVTCLSFPKKSFAFLGTLFYFTCSVELNSTCAKVLLRKTLGTPDSFLYPKSCQNHDMSPQYWVPSIGGTYQLSQLNPDVFFWQALHNDAVPAVFLYLLTTTPPAPAPSNRWPACHRRTGRRSSEWRRCWPCPPGWPAEYLPC